MVGVEGFKVSADASLAPNAHPLQMSEKKSMKLKFKGEKSHKKHRADDASGSRKRKREEDNGEHDTGW